MIQFIPQNEIMDIRTPLPQPEPPKPEPDETDDGKLDMVLEAVNEMVSKVKKKDPIPELTKAILGMNELLKKQSEDAIEIKQLLGRIADKEQAEIEFPKVQQVLVNNQPTFPELKIPDTFKVSNFPIDRTDEILMAIRGIQPVNTTIVVPTDEKEEPRDAGTSSGYSKRKVPRLIPETPTGTINGSNAVFYTTRNPKWGISAFLFLNGQYQTPSNDFTWSGNQITYTTAPASGSAHYVLFFQ